MTSLPDFFRFCSLRKVRTGRAFRRQSARKKIFVMVARKRRATLIDCPVVSRTDGAIRLALIASGGTVLPRNPDVTKAIEAAVSRAIRSELSGDLRRLDRQVGKLADRLTTLSRAVIRSGRGAAGIARTDRPPSPGRQLQGRYIGLLRNLNKRDQAKVKTARQKKGVEAAIKAALSLRKK